MKPFREQNYYELLDLAPDAGADAVAFIAQYVHVDETMPGEGGAVTPL